MRQSGSSVLIAVLCVAILFVFVTSPSRERIDAQQHESESIKSEVAEINSIAHVLKQSIEQQSLVNVKMAEADIVLIDTMHELSTHVSQLQSQVGKVQTEVVEAVKLTSAATVQDGGCTCGEKMAELQKQIDELKSRVATLEQTKTTAAAASSYGTVTASAPVGSGGSCGQSLVNRGLQVMEAARSGGSTGSVKTGGSTGSVAASGGSTGSVKSGGAPGPGESGYTYHTDPLTGWLMQCYHDGITSHVAPSKSTGSNKVAGDPHITVVTTPTCERCPAAIEAVQREYAPAGWRVDVFSEDMQVGKTYPYYRVCVGDQCVELQCPLSSLNDSVRAQLRAWGVPFSEPTTGSTVTSDKQTFQDRKPMRTAFQLVNSPIRATGNFLSQWGTGRALEVAQASAQYRAANRIKGHSQVDLSSGMANGVGWSTADPQPKTCFWNRRSQGAYASVQGADGTYYSTLVLY